MQTDVLRAYRDGWEWSPYMPRPEGSDTTPTTSHYRVPLAAPVTEWDEPMWIVRVVYTASEGGMARERITIGFGHPWKLFLRRGGLLAHHARGSAGSVRVIYEASVERFWRHTVQENGGVCFQVRAGACKRSTATRLRQPARRRDRDW